MKDSQQETDSVQALVKKAEEQGLPRPVAEEVVDDAIAEGVAPEKLEEVVEEAAVVEREDRKLAIDQQD